MPAKTFGSFDKFDRRPFADRLTKIVTRFYPLSEGAFVLSLNASFGAGKTTFLEMWKASLIEQGYNVVSINAWETDFDEDPVIPIISALLDATKQGEGAKRAANALKGVLGAGALVANNLLEKATGINIETTVNRVESEAKQSDLRAVGNEVYKAFQFKMRAYAELKEQLTAYIEIMEKPPLIVFVDELDRARPDYSVKFLEAIKHIFSVKGICFVLAVDREQLEISVRQLYGNVDFNNYYLRFITREANLPPINGINLLPFISQLSEVFFKQESAGGLYFPLSESQKAGFLSRVESVCKTFELRPRRIEYYFRVLSHFMAVAEHKSTYKDSWVTSAAILVGFMVYNEPLYHRIGQNKISVSELKQVIDNLRFEGEEGRNSKRSFSWDVYIGFIHQSHEGVIENEIADILMKFDERDINAGEFQDMRRKYLGYITQTYGAYSIPSKSIFKLLYDELESWGSFVKGE